MNDLEKYQQCFSKVFSLGADTDVTAAEMGGTPDWDSVGHMELITEVEDMFDIMLETEDILGFTSYIKGIEILKKYGVAI